MRLFWVYSHSGRSTDENQPFPGENYDYHIEIELCL